MTYADQEKIAKDLIEAARASASRTAAATRNLNGCDANTLHGLAMCLAKIYRKVTARAVFELIAACPARP